MRSSLFIALLLSLTLLISCGDDEPAETLPESTEIETSSPSFGIVNILQATGNDVEVVGDTLRPFFTTPAKVIAVDGSIVQLYEYESKEKLEAEAATISADGSTIGETKMQWEVSPHFYKTDKVIVLYEGDDSTMKQTLVDAVGPQFAGKP